MDELELKLNKLPQGRLSKSADFKLVIILRWQIIISHFSSWLSVMLKPGFFFARAVLAALVLMVIFGSTTIYAYASDAVLPGTELYPLKLVAEGIEKQLAITPRAKVKVYQKISERRLKEAVALSRINVDKSEEAIKVQRHRIKANIEAAVKELQNASDNAKAVSGQAISEEVTSGHERTRQYLRELGDKADDDIELPEDLKDFREFDKDIKKGSKDQSIDHESILDDSQVKGIKIETEQLTDYPKPSKVNKNKSKRKIRQQESDYIPSPTESNDTGRHTITRENLESSDRLQNQAPNLADDHNDSQDVNKPRLKQSRLNLKNDWEQTNQSNDKTTEVDEVDKQIFEANREAAKKLEEQHREDEQDAGELEKR